MEHHSYSTNIEIKGYPYKSNQNLSTIVQFIAEKINVKLNNSDIKHIHRTASRTSPKPIIIEFNSKYTKEYFITGFKSTGLKNGSDFGFDDPESQIFAHDHIIPWKKKLHYEANQLKNLRTTMTLSGLIMEKSIVEKMRIVTQY